jgi:putative membrane protein
MGMFLTGMGTLAMVLGTIEYWYRLQDLRKQNSFAIWRPSLVMALLMSAIGLFLFVGIIAKAL